MVSGIPWKFVSKDFKQMLVLGLHTFTWKSLEVGSENLVYSVQWSFLEGLKKKLDLLNSELLFDHKLQRGKPLKCPD